MSIVPTATKPGMEIVWPAVMKTDEMTGVLKLKAWAGTHAQRMSRLRAAFSNGELICGYSAESEDILRPARDVIYAEAKSIATADDQDQEVIRHLDFIRSYRDSQRRRGDSQVVPAPAAPSLTPKAIVRPPPVVPSESAR